MQSERFFCECDGSLRLPGKNTEAPCRSRKRERVIWTGQCSAACGCRSFRFAAIQIWIPSDKCHSPKTVCKKRPSVRKLRIVGNSLSEQIFGCAVPRLPVGSKLKNCPEIKIIRTEALGRLFSSPIDLRRAQAR